MKKHLIIGITGKIGSGKTTVCKIFQKLGANYIDADKITHNLYIPEQKGWEKIKKYFGEKFLDQKTLKINRKKLRELVFNKPQKLMLINQIIHPLVFEKIQEEIKKIKNEFVIIEAILFSKKYLGKLVDKIILIKCPEEIILKRNKKYPKELIKKVLKIQKNPKNPDFEIKNNKDKKFLKEQVKEIIKRI